MEPIRPDEDELRAEPPIGAAEVRKPRASKEREPGRGAPKAKPPGAAAGSGGGGGRGGRILVWGAILGLAVARSEEHTSELQSRPHLVCRLLLEKKKKILSVCEVVMKCS